MTLTLVTPQAPDDCVARFSELAEVGSLLHAACFIDHHPVSQDVVAAWFSEIDLQLLLAVRRWAPVWGPYRARYLHPLTLEQSLSFGDEIAGILRLPLPTFVDFTMQAILEGSHDAGDPLGEQVSPAILARASRLSRARGALAADVLKRPDESRQELVDVLSRVRRERVIDRELSRLSAVLRERSFSMTNALRTKGMSAVADVSPTVVAMDGGGRLAFDKQYHGTVRATHGLLLLPSHHLAPHLVVKGAEGYPAVVQYPPRNESAVSLATVTQRLRAVQDPTRRKIIRWLLRQPQPTVELALALGMAEPQVSRHLRILRDAGLVTTEREGRLVRYRVEQPTLERMGRDLVECLIR